MTYLIWVEDKIKIIDNILKFFLNVQDLNHSDPFIIPFLYLTVIASVIFKFEPWIFISFSKS